MTDGTEPVPENAEAFREALVSLLQHADQNDVGLERAWECRTDAAATDWEVDIVQLAPVEDREGAPSEPGGDA